MFYLISCFYIAPLPWRRCRWRGGEGDLAWENRYRCSPKQLGAHSTNDDLSRQGPANQRPSFRGPDQPRVRGAQRERERRAVCITHIHRCGHSCLSVACSVVSWLSQRGLPVRALSAFTLDLYMNTCNQ